MLCSSHTINHNNCLLPFCVFNCMTKRGLNRPLISQASWLPGSLPNFRSITQLLTLISRIRDSARFGGKTAYCLMDDKRYLNPPVLGDSKYSTAASSQPSNLHLLNATGRYEIILSKFDLNPITNIWSPIYSNVSLTLRNNSRLQYSPAVGRC